MKRLFSLVLFAFLLCGILCPPVSADFTQEEYKQQYDELLHSSGADGLFDILPKDAKGVLEEAKIKEVSKESLMQISFFDFLSSIWESIKSGFTKPLTMLLSCIGIILLCALLNSLKSSFHNQSYEHVFSVVSVICISSAIILPIANLIISISSLIKQVSNFLLSFIPVYVGIITASGKPISATAYSTAIIGVVQVISRISATVFVPLLGIYLAFCLIGSASHEINVEGIAKTVKTTVIVALSFLMTIFVGLLTVQGTVAASADTVALKTAKFAVSAFLPVVGSAISEALSSVQGFLGVIKSTVGGFGIIAVIAAFVPSIVSLLMMQFSLSIASGVSDALSTEKITSLLRSAQSVLSLILGITITFGVLLIVSLGVMLTVSGG